MFSILVTIAAIALGIAAFLLLPEFRRRETVQKNSLFVSEFVQSQQHEQQWIIDGDRARELLKQGAILLDARPENPLHRRIARPVAWQDFSQPHSPHRGKLLQDDAVLTAKLQSLGIDRDRPVVVFGDPLRGWGEEGRIVWMLRTLGHSQTYLVDGGVKALGNISLTSAPKQGDFTVQRVSTWEIGVNELRTAIAQDRLVVIDSREAREYQGQTPYGESRGGHLAKAIHLYYKDLLDEEGKLLGRETIFAKLQEKGIVPEMAIAVYCTGGVRSAWLTAVLVDMGFEVKNYSGSMWEWSSLPANHYPLINH
ncbi:sulfurtransferase [Spirulina sp. 06S082]|uniref:sulfurtransferase n=1 Tax=Spirulina sp. 06S082 TaxID=3110248 RepID=UPI002B21EE45|nr:rhodanese-like domain-containing protein [Spirulina sp. 06S082]MEA5470111.1 rhodanese-like domain-containing protein [Spirulina sp. 06S082]